MHREGTETLTHILLKKLRRTLLGRDASQGFRKLVSVATVGECFQFFFY